jgi:hypothetical protein
MSPAASVTTCVEPDDRRGSGATVPPRRRRRGFGLNATGQGSVPTARHRAGWRGPGARARRRPRGGAGGATSRPVTTQSSVAPCQRFAPGPAAPGDRAARRPATPRSCRAPRFPTRRSWWTARRLAAGRGSTTWSGCRRWCCRHRPSCSRLRPIRWCRRRCWRHPAGRCCSC